MHKVKLLKSENPFVLEDEINTFLKELIKHEIKSIKYSSAYDGSKVIYSTLIIYV